MTTTQLVKTAIQWMERGRVPDPVVRWAIRRLNRRTLKAEARLHADANGPRILDDLHRGPIALVPEKANEQHYEVPAAFFEMVLGPHLKYSSCYWPDGCESLAEAEAVALETTCERAGIKNGSDILELGCGWGSLTLWMAEEYPNSRITAVSNSHSQRHFIEARARSAGYSNIEVITADMNEFDTKRKYDQIVSIEMFEHMHNYDALFSRVASWLKDQGTLFLHVFCHRQFAYPYDTGEESDWMARHFFSGGLMPSADLFHHFQRDLRLDTQWQWDGRHYERTANAWLRNLDRRAPEVLPLLDETYGPVEARRWLQRWRMFFMACAEMFGQSQGREWFVLHSRFSKRAPSFQ